MYTILYISDIKLWNLVWKIAVMHRHVQRYGMATVKEQGGCQLIKGRMSKCVSFYTLKQWFSTFLACDLLKRCASCVCVIMHTFNHYFVAVKIQIQKKEN